MSVALSQRNRGDGSLRLFPTQPAKSNREEKEFNNVPQGVSPDMLFKPTEQTR